MRRRLIPIWFCCFAAHAMAAVLPNEAEQLHGSLTPTGAERGGNQDGSIPPWTDGALAVGLETEKPLLQLTAANYHAYVARLPLGLQAMFEHYPDFRMIIYPTHRTATLPPEVYRQIFANATRAEAAPSGIAHGIRGAAGGIPFPIPHNGTEVVWNHLLAFWGPARDDHIRNYFVAADGSLTLTNAYHELVDFPYYAPGATPATVGDYYFKRREISDAPPSLAGRGYLSWQPLDAEQSPVQAWQYLPREHRVRKSPLLSNDTPTPDGAGIESFDDYYIFSGIPDHYDFTLLGKAEMYVPYNNNAFAKRPIKAVAGRHFIDPDSLRYELHRVWVVEGRLAKGQHHLVTRRRLYIDEDSWFAVYGESWDDSGKLWKFSQASMVLLPELPAMVLGSQVTYDLQSGGYFLGFTSNDEARGLTPTALHDPALFTPEGLAAQSRY